MNITFTTYEKYNEEDISELELPEALENLLRRNNIFTIGSVIERIENDTLDDIRNMGVGKQRVIKNALFNYELCVAPDPIEFILNCERRDVEEKVA